MKQTLFSYPGESSSGTNEAVRRSRSGKTPGWKNSSRLYSSTFLFTVLAFLFASLPSLAQTTTITTETGTNYTGGNGVSGSSAVTFVVENTNSYPITLNSVDVYWQTANSGTVPTLWYSSTSLSGSPNIASPTWTSVVTAPAVTVAANGYFPTFTNLSLNIPANTTYRFAVQSTAGIRYSGTSPVPAPTTLSGGGVNLLTYDAMIGGSGVGYGGSFPSPTNYPRAFTGRINFQPALPCSGTPNGGNAVSSASAVCVNESFKLSLNNSSVGTGLTYQWQSSPDNTTWTDIAGATASTLTTSQSTATYYRAKLTCSGSTTPSASVQVTISGTGLSGNFTINKNAAASSTNFISFASAINALECGVTGPVTFNVVAGSGPYNEQVFIPSLIGSSATKRVTFEGNGNTITSLTTSGVAVVELNGADYVKFNNFKIKIDGAATAGIVFNMVNGANFNSITNSTIAVPTTSTSTTLYGVYINGGGNNIVENDSIIGGYYTVRVEDAASGTTTVNNQIRNNIVRDSYAYNFYVTNATGTQVEGNDISRPTRTAVTTFYGIYLLGTSSNTIISKNRIHNTHNAATSLTGAVYGFYITADAPVGSENIVKNNLIYNINNTGGTIYAIYNTGADGSYFFHNTFALDDANHTSTIRGFYLTTSASNIKFNNNIITLNGTGTTTKHAIYIASAAAVLESNNNVLYVYPAAISGGAAFTGYFTPTAYATLADWKTANGGVYDQNSVAVNPVYENPAAGNFSPTVFQVNNIGKPVGVTDDITGATRSATTPDPGAYEFTIPAKDLSVTAIVSPTGGCGTTSQETVIITVTNMGTDPQSNFPVQFSTNGGATWSNAEPISGTLAPGASTNYTFNAKADLSTPGAYNFQARTQLSGDGKTSNDTFTKIIDALPTIATFPYVEDFEGTAYTGWVASGTNSSWQLGTPNKTVIKGAASGVNAWVTKLTGGHNDNEQSQVVSPCFNLSSLQKPIIEMSIWWKAETSFDGAVLQYTTNNGQTWTNIGSYGETNWYNDNTIDAGPGGQAAASAEGWTGSSATSTPPSSSGWITVKHLLPTALIGQANARFRIAWATDAATVDDGFAFDNVKVYDTPANDVGVQGITQLASGCGLSNAQELTVTIRNFGLQPQSNIPVTYQVTKPDGTVMALVTETFAGTLNPNIPQTYTFTTKIDLTAPGTYSITACTDNADGDDQNDCKTITVRSLPTVATFPYSQDFENGDGGWLPSGTNSSWAIGTPNKTVIKGAASGTKAYVTGVTGTHNASENSVVVGPCFNFTTFTNSPIVDMKVWWNSEFSVDGAVLQSSTDNGVTWNNVGFVGDPNNWYNNGTIDANPGNQVTPTLAEGWTGTGTNGSGMWVRARHALTGLAGQGNVKLRVAFASNGTNQNDGFAFDDIRVYEQQNIDGAVTFIYPLKTNACGVTAQEEVKVTIENFGLQPLVNVPVSFQVTPENGTPLAEVNETATGTIAPGASLTYTFTGKANLSNVGVNTLVAKTKITGDQVPSNDAFSILQTTIPTISTFPYTQGFENGDGGWKASGTLSSWVLGKPAKTIINTAATGTKSWVTNLTSTYNASENSQILGPCFNFSTITEPVFQMKAWWYAQASYDGAVLQSSIDNGLTWQNVGAKGDANSLNWFNDNTINAGPGGQSPAAAQGWTGTAATGTTPTSGGWVTVRHALTGLAGQSNVKLRIAFAADATTQNDGFAFDDILIEDVANNIAVTAFKPLVKICGYGANEPVEVTLTNLSNTPITSGITLQYTVSLNGNVIFTSQSAPFNNTLPASGSAQFQFPQGTNLSQPGTYTITITANLTGDPDAANNVFTATFNNVLLAQPAGFTFEPGQKGLSDIRTVIGSKAAIAENVAASSPLTAGSTKGIIMDAVTGSPWTLPILLVDPWTNNLDNKSGVYMCFPAQPQSDSLWLLFDLKQTFKVANANTNFRVTVNGNMVGTTYRPPADGTPDVWKTIKVNLTQYKNQALQIGLESSTKEAYQNGTGTANLVDNIFVRGRVINLGSKDEVLQGQLSVFPNPSKGQFNVSLPQGKSYELEVMDLTGRTLKKQTVKGGSSLLDMQGASQGIYLLKVKSDKGTAVGKLIIE